MPIFSRFRLWVLLGLLASSVAAAFGQGLPKEQTEKFTGKFKECFSKKDIEAMLSHVWWRGADAKSKANLREAFGEITQFRLHSMKFRGLSAEDSVIDGSERSLMTDIPIQSVLTLELAVVENPDPDSVFMFEYPIGVSDGKLWILPVLDRSRRR